MERLGARSGPSTIFAERRRRAVMAASGKNTLPVCMLRHIKRFAFTIPHTRLPATAIHMSYPALLILHLFAAIMFVGTVFFEVIMLEGVRRHVSKEVIRPMAAAIGPPARAVMRWARA